MAISFGTTPVDNRDESNSQPYVEVTITGTTAGRTLVLFGRWDTGRTFSSITCSGETVSLIGSGITETASIFAGVQIAMINSLASGGSKTIRLTLSGNTARAAIAALEIYSSAALSVDSSVYLNTHGNVNTTIDVTSANDAILGFATSTEIMNADTGNGYTGFPGGIYSVNAAAAIQYNMNVGAAGTKTVQWTGGGYASGRIMAIVAVKEASQLNVPLTVIKHRRFGFYPGAL